MKSIKVLAAVLIAAGLLAVPVTAATAADNPYPDNPPEPTLCEYGDGAVAKFPYVMHLRDSDEYPDGARTCAYWGKRKVNYSCRTSDPDARRTFIHVVANNTRERHIIPIRCDGKLHSLDFNKMYGNTNSPNYHLHWQYENGHWDRAYLAIS